MLIPCTPKQYATKVVQLQKDYGIVISGPAGQVHYRGATFNYLFDGKAELEITIVHLPVLVSHAYATSVIQKLFQS